MTGLAEVLAGWILFNTGGCLSGSPLNMYINEKTKEIYCGSQPPTESGLANWRERVAQDDEEDVRFCMSQPRGGVEGPHAICTGALDPYYLRSGKSQWEAVIQKILSDNAKYGVR